MSVPAKAESDILNACAELVEVLSMYKKIVVIMFLATMMLSSTVPSIKAARDAGGGRAVQRGPGEIQSDTGGGREVDTLIPAGSAEGLPDPLGGATIFGLLEKIVNWLQKISTPIAAIMIIYGAYQILFAGGEAEKVKSGRNTILYAALGYGIILIGWGITTIIEEFFG